jgi:prepilin-type processing-associated H-X9-DG protein/prepilin-type N-terminal cleavage/methylation domain-containing protein
MTSHSTPRRVVGGFTLVELLVVIGIIGVMISILIPTLGKAREQARRVQCMSNLRELGIAVRNYARENQDAFYPIAPNRGNVYQRLNPTPSITRYRILRPNEADAYWGMGYLKYLAGTPAYERYWQPNVVATTIDEVDSIIGRARKIFSCPSVNQMDPEAFFTDNGDTIRPSYGLNSFVIGKKKLSKVRPAAEVVFAQDHVEHKLDGGGDMLAKFGDPVNLAQWRIEYNNAYWVFPDAIPEIFRHKGVCNILWMDGHVSSIPRGSNDGLLPDRAYTGN